MATDPIRAGGHIDRGDGKGWVVDDTPPASPPKERPRKQLVTQGPDSGSWVLAEPEPVAVEPEPESEEEAAAAEPVPAPRKRGRPRKNT